MHFRFRRRGLEEDVAWSKVATAIHRVRPLDEPEQRSLQYAASEVINNAVDHSGGRRVETRVDFAGQTWASRDAAGLTTACSPNAETPR